MTTKGNNPAAAAAATPTTPARPRSGWFGGLGKADDTGAGNWFRRGTYLCEVVSIVRRESTDPAKKGARLVIASLSVVEVMTAFPESQAVGESGTVFCNLDSKYPSMDLGRLKGLIGAILGSTDDLSDDAWDEMAETLTTPPGTAAAGSRLIVEAVPTTTRGGATINALVFRPAPAARAS